MNAYADMADRIEATVADEAGLRRLDREIAADRRLDREEREHLRGRVEFYLGDMHFKLRPPPEIFE